MLNIRLEIVFVVLIFLAASAPEAKANSRAYMIRYPQHYIEIPEWNVYSSWSGVGILYNLKIVNNSDVEYKNVKIRVYYSTTSTNAPGTIVSQHTGVIPVTLPPRSTGTYLRSGIPFGANSQFMNAVRLEVLGAEYNP